MVVSSEIGELLSESLSALGYAKRNGLHFESVWMPDTVKQLLSFSFVGRPPNFLTCVFGLHEKQSQAFASFCNLNFGHPVHRALDGRRLDSCLLNFQLRTFGGSEFGWMPFIDLDRESFVKVVRQEVGYHIKAELFRINSPRELLNLLVDDRPLTRWFLVSAPLRIAQIAFLAWQTGMVESEIYNLLRSLESKAQVGFASERVDFEGYVSKVLSQLLRKGDASI